MRRKLVAANWKMHGHRADVTRLVESIKGGLAAVDCDVLICPPSLFIEQVEKSLKGSNIGSETGNRIAIGAQNAHPEEAGAFTGEVSVSMLGEFSCTHVIVGHSERRELFGETDDFVAEKFIASQAHGLTPILCVGESQAQRENAETETFVLGQLQAVLDKAGIAAFANALIAYEPIWAIGTGLTASPEQAQEVHDVLRSRLAELDEGIAAGIRIIYGGSVKASNAKELFAQRDIDGALVGGASLQADEFIKICEAAAD